MMPLCILAGFLTAERLRELFEYCPETGIFKRLVGQGRGAVGRPVGSSDKYGYVQIMVDGRFYLAHRLAWLFVRGKWPENDIDHIDTIKNDNRLANLREATRAQNLANTFARRQGLKGASRCRADRSGSRKFEWQAQICKGGKRMHLGYYNSEAEAHTAYVIAAEKCFGEFARTE